MTVPLKLLGFFVVCIQPQGIKLGDRVAVHVTVDIRPVAVADRIASQIADIITVTETVINEAKICLFFFSIVLESVRIIPPLIRTSPIRLVQCELYEGCGGRTACGAGDGFCCGSIFLLNTGV